MNVYIGPLYATGYTTMSDPYCPLQLVVLRVPTIEPLIEPAQSPFRYTIQIRQSIGITEGASRKMDRIGILMEDKREILLFTGFAVQLARRDRGSEIRLGLFSPGLASFLPLTHNQDRGMA